MEFGRDLPVMLAVFREIRKRRRRPRRWSVRPINTVRNIQGEIRLVRDLRYHDEECHFHYFRMSKVRFDQLLTKLLPMLSAHAQTHPLPIDPLIKLAVTLRILSTGDSQSTVAMSFRIGHTTVNKILYETCEILWSNLKNEFLSVPATEKWQSISEEFENQWNFPGCLGSIDGKHIAIKAPKNAGSVFFNYKGFHSIVLLAIADAKYAFILVDIGAPGRNSDGGIWSSSPMSSLLERNDDSLPKSESILPYTFVADDAFPLKTFIMKPYSRRNLDFDEKVFNYRLSRARRTIENAFGILSARWRIYHRTLDASPSHAISMTKACVVLHNYLTKTDISNPRMSKYIPDQYADYDSNEIVVPGEWRREATTLLNIGPVGSNNYTQEASRVRDAFKAYFLSPEGKVQWQDSVVNRGCKT